MIIKSHLAPFFFRKGREGGLRHHLAWAITGTFGLKGIATGLSFVISILLARVLGITGYGAYSYAMAWVTLLGMLALLGLDKLLVRYVAAYQTQSAWGLIRGLLRWANSMTLLVSSGLVVLGVGVTWLLAKRGDSEMLEALQVALFSIPLVALVGLRQATLRGLSHVVAGILPEMLVRPLAFILLVGCTYLLVGGELSAPWAVGLNILAISIAFLLGTYLLHKALPSAVRKATPAYHTRAWIQSMVPLICIGGVQAVHSQAVPLMLGALKDADAVAVYHVADRGAQLVAFILTAVNTALGPTIASLYAAGDVQRLQRVITKSARIVVYVSLPIAVGLIVCGKWFLLLFGADFTRAYGTLTILSMSYLIDTVAGSVGILLIMTGHERDAALSLGMRATLHVLLNLVLIPRWGAEGAAMATAASVIVWNVLLVVWVYAKLGIHATALGKIRLWSEA